MKELTSKIALALLVSGLVFGVGFSIFSDTMDVTGTALTSEDINVDVDSVYVSKSVGSTNNSIIGISKDRDTVSLLVHNLESPGSSVSFLITVKNSGVLNAIVKSIETSNTNENITINYEALSVGNVISVNDLQSFVINVIWNEDSKETNIITDFNINIEYAQYVA